MSTHAPKNPFHPYTYQGSGPDDYICNVCGWTCPTGPMGPHGEYPGAKPMLEHLRREHDAQKVWDTRRSGTPEGVDGMADPNATGSRAAVADLAEYLPALRAELQRWEAERTQLDTKIKNRTWLINALQIDFDRERKAGRV